MPRHRSHPELASSRKHNRLRPKSGIVLVIACCLLGGSSATNVDAVDHEQPHIVMIFSDDQGYHDVGCYGSEIETPHLDRLASEGMRFTQFYAASSICTPSRYGLFTGRCPHRSRDALLGALMFLDEGDAKRGIHAGERTYVAALHDAGYQTALVGKWHLGHGDEEFWPTRHGFDSFFGHTGGCVDFFTLQYGNRPDWYRGKSLVATNGYATDVITDEAVAILKQTRQSDRPLYLHVSYNAPHFGKGWNREQQTTENVMQPKPADLKKVSDIEEPLRRAFAAKVVGMDEGVGRLLDTLDELEISDRTLVIFMTDHGGDPDFGGSNQPLRGGKATLFEGGIRVPCLVRWPGVVPQGRRSDAVAWAIDWAPTLTEIAGADWTAESGDGQSILSVLRGESAGESRTMVWRTGAHQLLERKSWYAVRDSDWKWVQPPDQSGMLFDLARDPNEMVDLSDKHPDKSRQLRMLATE